MKTILLAGGLMLAVVYPAQALQASLNCNHFVGTHEDRMIDAVRAATKIGKQHPDFCRAQSSANEAIEKWLKAAEICRTRMVDYAKRVSEAAETKQMVVSVLQNSCKFN